MACKNSRNGLLRNGLVVSELFYRACLICLPSVVVFIHLPFLDFFSFWFCFFFFALGWLFFFFFFFLRFLFFAWQVLHRQLAKLHGELTVEATIQQVVPIVQTGDLHVAIYDLTSMMMSVANARGANETGPKMAYDRQFVQLNMTKLFATQPNIIWRYLEGVHICTAVNHQNVMDTDTPKGTIDVSNNDKKIK